MSAILLTLLLAQLQFVEDRPTPLLPPDQQPPTCHWGVVDVWCQSGCDCSEVTSRLELARTETQANWADAPADWWSALKGWRIFITQKQYIPGPNNEKLYGVVLAAEKRIVLSWDMCGVLHELIHVQEIGLGRALDRRDMYDHPLWDQNPAVKEISDRFRLRFRNRPP